MPVSSYDLPRGDASQGEIEILIDPEKMALIERQSGRDVGVLKEDPYWIWVNDACQFPNGREGVYGHILWVRSLEQSAPGVAVVALTAEGKIILNCNFRHSTRAWEIELPRGIVNPRESPQDAARREVLEETGRIVVDIQLLGEMPPNTGALSEVVPIFLAAVVGSREQRLEDSEAVEDILELSIEEIKKAFADGYYDCMFRGEMRRVFFRDPFLACALLHLL